MEIQENNSVPAATIPQAADFLGVTTKTIRNYIQRGLLEAEKWNGAWRISGPSLQAVSWKRRGRLPQESQSSNVKPGPRVPGDGLTISPHEYAELEKKAGLLEASTRRVEELVGENADLRKRIEQLEATAASAWTEMRAQKETIASLRNELDGRQSELDELRRTAEKSRKNLERVRLLEEWLKEERDARGAVEVRLQKTQDRYRREVMVEADGE